MAKSVLNRSLSFSLLHTHMHTHTQISINTNTYPHSHIDSQVQTHMHMHSHADTHAWACIIKILPLTHMLVFVWYTQTHSHMHSGRNTRMSMHYQDTFTHQHVDFCMEQCFEIDSWFFHASRFPDISSIKLKMPNIHFLPVNLKNKDNQTIVKVRPFFTSDACQKLWQIFEVYMIIDVAHHK